MAEPASQPRFSAFARKSNGPKVLAATGAFFVLMTVLGAVFQSAFPKQLWSQLFFSVSIAGLVGFFTNWVAIKMLFHPRVKFMGIQGVVPSRRVELAKSVAATMEEHLISADRMHKLLVESGAVARTLETLSKRLPELLSDPHARAAAQNEVRRGIQTGIETISEDARAALKKKLRSNITALISGATAGMTLGPLAGILAAGASKSGMLDPLVDKLMTDMIDELSTNGGLDKAAAGIVSQLPKATGDMLKDKNVRERLTQLVFDASEELVKAIDVKKLVEQELLAHDDSELEGLIDAVASNELVFIQVAGGALGMAAGLALVWPVLLVPFGAAFAAMWLAGRAAEAKAANRAPSVGAGARTEEEAQANAPAGAAEPAKVVETKTEAALSPKALEHKPIDAEFVSIPAEEKEEETATP
ncbi:MAG: DUF445 family protein [Planctomycetes bacterium]|nr:DUF445 family protein [Planctomycetota bacterium]